MVSLSTKRQQKRYQLKITGLTNKDTKIKESVIQNGIQALGEVSSIKRDELVGSSTTVNSNAYLKLKRWLATKYQTEIFDYANQNTTEGNSGLTITAGNTADSINVVISLNAGACYTNGKLSQNSKTFQSIRISWFATNGNTTINSNVASNGISVNSFLSKYSPYEIADSLGVDEPNDIKDNILKFIYDNRSLIFTNLPSEKWDNAQFYENINLNNGYYEFVSSTHTSLKIKFSVKNIYSNEIISTSWQHKYFELKLTGLTNKDTSYKNQTNEISVLNTNLSDLTGYKIVDALNNQTSRISIKQDVINLIYNNRNNMFKNIESWDNKNPNDCINIDRGYFSIENKGSNSLTIVFSAKNIYDNGSFKDNWLKNKFSIKLTNLQENRTMLNPVINIDDLLTSTNTTIQNVTPDQLKEYIINNNLIKNMPEPFTPNDISVEIKSINPDSNEIQAIITLKKYYTENGDLVESSDKGKSFSVTFNTVTNDHNGSNSSTNSSNNNFYWIWIIIAASILLLIILTILIILLIKKKQKNNKKATPNTRVASLSQTPQNMRLRNSGNVPAIRNLNANRPGAYPRNNINNNNANRINSSIANQNSSNKVIYKTKKR